MKRGWLILGLVLACATAFTLAWEPLSSPHVPPAQPLSKAVAASAVSTTEPSIADVPVAEPVTVQAGIDLLHKGRDWLQAIPDYTATFHKQERVHGELRELETIQLKVRHVPFSVAMAWEGNGRQAFYRDGVNANRMVVKMGGWKGRLGWVNLELYSSLAMQYARYPITDVGMLKLTEQLLERFEPYRDKTDGVTCVWQSPETIGGRECRVFAVEYESPAINPDYRRTVVWLDTEWNVPLAVENFDWDTSDPANPGGLVEYYVYENVHLHPRLTDLDFIHDAKPDPGTAVVESK